jgi:hypothetical protein
MFDFFLRAGPERSPKLPHQRKHTATPSYKEIMDLRKRRDLGKKQRRFCRPLPYHLATAPIYGAEIGGTIPGESAPAVVVQ